MDSYVDLFESHGGAMITLAKGNRSQQVTDACKSTRRLLSGLDRRPGGDLWRKKKTSRKSKCSNIPELGMEAIWKIEVVDFPAFILVDDKGNDFFKQILH